jgi:hypothetical protein
MPLVVGQPIFINRSNALVAAGKFLRLKEDGQGGLLNKWLDLDLLWC